MSKINTVKKAGQLARAIASDIAVYNTSKIEQALKDDNVFEILGDEIEEGRSLFHTRVSEEITANTNIFEKALIDIIIAGRSHVKTHIW
ncbi:MAG: hypothetical protein AAFX99_01750 [Myxococcota bacterium]